MTDEEAIRQTLEARAELLEDAIADAADALNVAREHLIDWMSTPNHLVMELATSPEMVATGERGLSVLEGRILGQRSMPGWRGDAGMEDAVTTAIEMQITEPCGECSACRLRAEVVKCLEHLDRKMIPPYQRALEELQAERRGSGRDYVLRELSRSASRRKAEWMESRERFLTPEVCRRIMCERLGPVAIVVPR